MSSAPTTGCTASRAPCGASIPGVRPTRSSRSKTSVARVRKPDLARAEAFAAAFGFTTALRTRTSCARHRPRRAVRADPPRPALAVRRAGVRRRRAVRSAAAGRRDRRHSSPAARDPWRGGGRASRPSGLALRVVSGTHQLEALPAQQPHVFNFGHEVVRANTTQRPPRVPTRVQRLGTWSCRLPSTSKR